MGPILHRFGQKFDHGFLSVTWRWKPKRTQRCKTADFKDMDDQSWVSFDQDLRIRMQEAKETRVFQPGHNGHRRNCAFINAAKEKLPTNQTKTDTWPELEKMRECTKETITAVVPKKKKKFKNGSIND